MNIINKLCVLINFKIITLCIKEETVHETRQDEGPLAYKWY